MRVGLFLLLILITEPIFANKSCRALFNQPGEQTESIRSWFYPREFQHFDVDEYHRALSAPIDGFRPHNNLPSTLGLMDRVLGEENFWQSQLRSMPLIASYQLRNLIKDYSVSDLRDAKLRAQFITKLFLLIDPVQTLQDRRHVSQSLNLGLERLLSEMFHDRPALFQRARWYFKYLAESGWLSLPIRLPLITEDWGDNPGPWPPIESKLIWKGIRSGDLPDSSKYETQFEWAARYNKFAQIYNTWSSMILFSVMLALLPDIEEEVQVMTESLESNADRVRHQEAQERYDRFQKSLAELEQELKHLEREKADQQILKE